MDTMSKEKRSALMARIRGDSLRPESALAAALDRAGLDCFRNVPDFPGRPDFVLERNDQALAVFVDGCFWHCCPRHWRMPKSNAAKWAMKFRANKARDRRVRRELVRGYFHSTMTVWEHDLKTSEAADKAARRVKARLEAFR